MRAQWSAIPGLGNSGRQEPYAQVFRLSGDDASLITIDRAEVDLADWMFMPKTKQAVKTVRKVIAGYCLNETTLACYTPHNSGLGQRAFTIR
jgi:hypothetical protein